MANPQSTNPSRQSLARRRGLTKNQLAVAIGVKRQSMTAYESGAFSPRPRCLQKLARVLRFPEAFFVGADLEEPSPETATFCAATKTVTERWAVPPWRLSCTNGLRPASRSRCVDNRQT